MLSKTKKVAIFVDGEFIPSFSGATNRFHYLSRALQKFTDTEVVIILCDRGWSDIGETIQTYWREGRMGMYRVRLTSPQMRGIIAAR
jgi:hypothetical protein